MIVVAFFWGEVVVTGMWGKSPISRRSMFPAEVGGLTSVLFSDELLVYSYFSPSGFDIYEKSIFIGLKIQSN